MSGGSRGARAKTTTTTETSGAQAKLLYEERSGREEVWVGEWEGGVRRSVGGGARGGSGQSFSNKHAPVLAVRHCLLVSSVMELPRRLLMEAFFLVCVFYDVNVVST